MIMQPLTVGLLTIFLIGCSDNLSATSKSDLSSSSEDEHDDTKHGHPPKRHPETDSLGRKIVPIGHSHKSGKITWFYARMMPVIDFRLSWQTLAGTEEDLTPVELTSSEVLAYIFKSGGDPNSAAEITFTAEESDPTVFSATIPDRLRASEGWQISIPKATRDSARLRFSFSMPNPGFPTSNAVDRDMEKPIVPREVRSETKK